MFNLFQDNSNPDGTPDATVKYAEDAAALVSLWGDRARVVSQETGRTVWTQGVDYDGDAGGSYDSAADVMHARIETQRKAHARIETQRKAR